MTGLLSRLNQVLPIDQTRIARGGSGFLHEQDPSLHVVIATSSVTDDGMDEGVIPVSQRWVTIAGSKVDGMIDLVLDGDLLSCVMSQRPLSHVSLRWLVDSSRNAWKVAADRGLSATACLVAGMTGVVTPLSHVGVGFSKGSANQDFLKEAQSGLAEVDTTGVVALEEGSLGSGNSGPGRIRSWI
ncbi:hypothetical protein NE237_022405 [Protea cynaroides]|uniref:Uncharacterized protein n=1 Tax=Protea cynaroides TaxID=273540 RepID=A0A9Q0H9J3_9MAGN|nr:hypothetical protein NE237_022405 [Protea cynaroides]